MKYREFQSHMNEIFVSEDYQKEEYSKFMNQELIVNSSHQDFLN